MMNIKKYLEYIKENSMNFDGRAGRKEFWTFFLVTSLISVILRVPVVIFEESPTICLFFAFLLVAFNLALCSTLVGSMIRRLHDTGRSAWWLLVFLIPILGLFILLALFCLKSTPSENDYGMPPELNSNEI